MKRGRRRPGKDADDIALVLTVRAGKTLGLTVAAACRGIASNWTATDRVRRGYDRLEEECAEQLKKRYQRISRKYVAWEPSEPRLRAVARAMGFAPRVVRRRSSATTLVRGRAHKKPLRRGTLH